eukprot:m.356832 g.356832  ORF g.356832 m.356832 type:complete len:2401 (+) comp17639_c0_seq1:342-7544(+)
MLVRRSSSTGSSSKSSRTGPVAIEQDTAALKSAWYLGNANHSVASKIIKGKATGTFLIRVSQSYPNTFILAFIDEQGKPRNEVIVMDSRGYRLHKSKVAFSKLSQLVDFYSNPLNSKVSLLPCVLVPQSLGLKDVQMFKAPSSRKAVHSLDLSDQSINSTHMHSMLQAPLASPMLLGSLKRSGSLRTLKRNKEMKDMEKLQRQQHQQRQRKHTKRGETIVELTVVERSRASQMVAVWPQVPTPDSMPENFPLVTPIDVRGILRLPETHWEPANILNWVVDDPLETWKPSHVQEWLYSIGAAEAAGTFQAYDIDGEKMASITVQKLVDLGVRKPLAMEIMAQYNHLRESASAADQTFQLSRHSSLSSVQERTLSAPTDPVSTWDKYAVRAWLVYEGYDSLAHTCLDHDVDGETLTQLTEDELQGLGVASSHDRWAILDKIRQLKTQEHNQSFIAHPDAEKPMHEWSIAEVGRFLTENGFSVHVPVFRSHRIRGSALVLLAKSPSSMRELGVLFPNEQLAIAAAINSTAYPQLFRTHIEDWTTGDVHTWLGIAGLEEHSYSFQREKINGSTLLRLEQQDIEHMGVTQQNQISNFFAGQQVLRHMHDVQATGVTAPPSSTAPHIASAITWTEHTVTINKGPKGFGFQIAGGSGMNEDPCVSGVTAGGPADGKLFVGDVMQTVNGRTVEDGRIDDIKGLIMRSGPQVTVQVLRPSRVSGVLTELAATVGAGILSPPPVQPRATSRLARQTTPNGKSRLHPASTSHTTTRTTVDTSSDADATYEYAMHGVSPHQYDNQVLLYQSTDSEQDGASGAQSLSSSSFVGGINPPRPDDVRRTFELQLTPTPEHLQSSPRSQSHPDQSMIGQLSGSSSSEGDGGGDGGGVGGEVQESEQSSRSSKTTTLRTTTVTKTTTMTTGASASASSSSRFAAAAAADEASEGQGGPVSSMSEDLKSLSISTPLATSDPKPMSSPQLTKLLKQSDEAFANSRSTHLGRVPSLSLNDSPSFDAALSSSSSSDAALDEHPVAWTPVQVAAHFVNMGEDEVGVELKKRKVSGLMLLQMDEERADELNLEQPQKAAVMREVSRLQELTPVPLAACWKQVDVVEWIRFNGYTEAKKPFSKKKVDGVGLCTLTEEKLVAMDVPEHLHKPLLKASSKLRNTTTCDTSNPSAWSAPEVCDFLVSQGFKHVTPAFSRKKIDGKQLLSLEHSDLYSMGIKDTSDQTALVACIQSLTNSPHGSPRPDLQRYGGTLADSLPTISVSSMTPQPSGVMLHHSASVASDSYSRDTDATIYLVPEWSVQTVSDWFATHNLGHYCTHAVKHSIDGIHLAENPADVYESYGFESSDAKRVVREVDRQFARDFTQHYDAARQGIWRWDALQVQMNLQGFGLDSITEKIGADTNGVGLITMTKDAAMAKGVTQEEWTQLQAALEAEAAQSAFPLKEGVARWSPVEVNQWLRRHGHTSVLGPFQVHGVDGQGLLRLNARQLHRMNVRPQDHAQLLEDVDELRYNLEDVGNDPREWSAERVSKWLTQEGLAHHSERLENLGISGPLLLSLKETDLDEMGVPNGLQRQELLDAIARLHHLKPQRASSPRAQTLFRVRHEVNHEVNSWTPTDVGTWLQDNGLGQLCTVIQKHSVTGPALLRIKPEDLNRMDIIDVNDRSALLTAVSRLRMGLIDQSGLDRSVLPVEELNAEWYSPTMLTSRARVLLTDPTYEGNFVIHQAQTDESAYTLTYIHQDVVEHVPILMSSGNLSVLGSQEHFRDLTSLVERYSDTKQDTGVLPCHLNFTHKKRRPKSVTSDPSQAASWDKRHTPMFSYTRYLSGQKPGCFCVTRKMGDWGAQLHMVNDEGEVETFVVSVAEENGAVGYQLEGDAKVYLTMDELVSAHMRKATVLPTKLVAFDMRRSIKAQITSKKREAAWEWWQLDASHDDAEAVIADKATGAFVVYTCPMGGYILAYKAQGSIHRERIYHNVGSDRTNDGYYLAKNQLYVEPTLQGLIEYYCETTDVLLCPLRQSIKPSPALKPPTSSAPSPMKATRTPLSWLQQGLEGADDVESLLGSRGTGAFVVVPNNPTHTEWTLAYKFARKTHKHTIQTKYTPEGKFVGFFMVDVPRLMCPTLQDLVIHHENQRHSLECVLDIATMSLLRRPHHRAGSARTKPSKWMWCQLGVPRDEVVAYMDKQPRGVFVVCTATDAERAAAPSHMMTMILNTSNASNPAQHRFVPIHVNEQRRLQLADGDAGDVQSAASLEELIVNVLESSSFGRLLHWPPTSNQSRVVSPRLIRSARAKGASETFCWWQVDSTPASALALLEGQRMGAFVVYYDSTNKLMLSYVGLKNICHQSIVQTKRFGAGYCLESAPLSVKPTVKELVHSLCVHAGPLECPLRVLEDVGDETQVRVVHTQSSS